MFIAEARFPIVDGDILAAFRDHLGWSSLTVQLKLPAPVGMPKRLVTLRDDSGPQGLTTAVQRKGINVWADTFVDSKNLALDCMEIARQLPRLVGPIKASGEFIGPYEIDDEPEFTFGTTTLVHHYFAFAVTVKADAPAGS